MRALQLCMALGVAVLPAQASAQQTVFVGAGAVIPMGEFGSVADLGYQAQVGGTMQLAETHFVIGAAGFFGRADHEIPGERSTLYGATVLAGYSIATRYDLTVTGWAGLGGMIHAHESGTFPGLDASRRGLTVNAGGGVARPVGRVSAFVSALYTRGVGGLGTSAYPTEWITLGGGIAIPIGMD